MSEGALAACCETRLGVREGISVLREQFENLSLDASSGAAQRVDAHPDTPPDALGHPIWAAVAALHSSPLARTLRWVVTSIMQRRCGCDRTRPPRLGDFDEHGFRTFGGSTARLLARLTAQAAASTRQGRLAFSFAAADDEAHAFVETLDRWASRLTISIAAERSAECARWRALEARARYHAIRHECQVLAPSIAIEVATTQLALEHDPAVRNALSVQLLRLARARKLPVPILALDQVDEDAAISCDLAYELALAAIAQGDLQPARVHLERGLEQLSRVHPRRDWLRIRTKLWNCSALLQYRAGNFNEALLAEARVLEVDDVDESCRDAWDLAIVSSAMNTARILEKTGDMEGAARCLSSAVETLRCEPQNVLVELGRMAYDRQRFADAESWYSRALRCRTTIFAVSLELEVLARLQLALCKAQLGRQRDVIASDVEQLRRWAEILPAESSRQIEAICNSLV